MRRLRRNFRKNQSKIILTTAFALVFCLCVGYAAFQTVINFNVKGNIKKKLLTPRDLAKNVVTTGDGLYADTTEAGRYIYRGASPDNYIKLGDDMYRIIAVESDNTLKIIKNGSIGRKEFDYTTDRDSTISTDYCTSTHGCNVWGSKTTMLDTNGNNVIQMPKEVNGTLYNLPDKEATLNTYLNNDWYNLLDNNIKSKIETHLFNVGGINTDEIILAITISEEAAYKWRGKIGLMNPSDYVKASINSACTSVNSYYNNKSCYDNSETHNWIYAGPAARNYSWTIASAFNTSADGVVDVIYGGSFDANGTGLTVGVAPVFYLSSDIILTGSGTESDPYILKE